MNLILTCLVVAPFTGAWIEIQDVIDRAQYGCPVAPFTGAWIEITKLNRIHTSNIVAPFTGAWIEIDRKAGPNV